MNDRRRGSPPHRASPAPILMLVALAVPAFTAARHPAAAAPAAPATFAEKTRGLERREGLLVTHLDRKGGRRVPDRQALADRAAQLGREALGPHARVRRAKAQGGQDRGADDREQGPD